MKGGIMSPTKYMSWHYQEFSSLIASPLPPGLVPAQFLLSCWMPETFPHHRRAWEVLLPETGCGVSVLATAPPPRYLGAVFGGAGHFPVFCVRRGREEFLSLGWQMALPGRL